ncbi:MarR family winged helix-turn-helix transcriptional regulator [Cohnella cholangitidis]|uniref:MarR family transcriptional regulator n=1 Tax=Cohnella cholangitidis TaxID=2598458 RepID=A0A7G5C248_9BACL|nr:MarR family transcriptional regulator [Cohnella cholangitidis]QMV43282.1 MarR family transcriptional regulator [Cohnella cholangitidis]
MKTNPYDLNRSLGFLMGNTYRKLSALFQSGLKEFDITPEQWSVLYQVDQADGLIQKEIAERSGKDRPTTTRILDHLEQKELVYKKIGESDRRSFRVYMTSKGKNLIQETIPIEKRVNAEIKKCIAEEEYETLLKLMMTISIHVNEITDKE